MISKDVLLVEELLIGIDSIPNQLRNDHHFDRESYMKLIKVLHKLISYYSDKNEVPKRLALCFVDISNVFFMNNDFFTEKELDEIEDAGMRISELANKLFS